MSATITIEEAQANLKALICKLGGGDEIFITEAAEGYRITPHNPAFEAQMKAARKVMKSRRAVLRELAK